MRFAASVQIVAFLVACKAPRQDSGLRDDGAAAAAADPCPQRTMAFDGPAIVLTFPGECILAQITPKVTQSFAEINAGTPHYLSPFEFRAYDANMAMQSDTLELDPGTSVEGNVIKLRFKDVVGYRIKVDAKDPRHGQAWIGALAAIELRVEDWNFRQEVKEVHIDSSFGAGNEEDRKRINTMLTFAEALSKFVGGFTRNMTFGLAVYDPLEEQMAKARKVIAAGLLDAAKDSPSLKEQVPPPFTRITESHSANGGIVGGNLVVRLTPRAAAP